jgi:hypothetical protein
MASIAGRLAGLFLVGIWLAAAAAPAVPMLYAVGLEMSSAEIDQQLAGTPGIAERSARSGEDGSIERRFLLKDETFVRAVFPTGAETAKPLSLSFALGDAIDAASVARNLEAALGPPGWIRRSNGNTVVRRVWGGQGREEGAIQPDRNARHVVEVIATPRGGASSVLIAKPQWFSQGKSR